MARSLRPVLQQMVCGRALRPDDRPTDGGAGKRSVEDRGCPGDRRNGERRGSRYRVVGSGAPVGPEWRSPALRPRDGVMLDFATDRKSTRLNSSHLVISYAVFCLKK